MPQSTRAVMDANEAVARVAHLLSEVIADLPHHPLLADGRVRRRVVGPGRTNVWGTIPQVAEMQSEAGAAGAVHGSLQAGALTTTFTACQGLLLMIPNMYKIAGELTAYAHARRRPHAGHPRPVDLRRPLRRDGLPPDRLRHAAASSSVQEAHDLAAVAHAATLQPGARSCTSSTGSAPRHEVAKIEVLDDDDLRGLIDRGDRAATASAASPRPARPARHRPEPRHLLPGPRGRNRFYHAVPEVVAGGHGPVRRGDRPGLPAVRLRRPPAKRSGWWS